MHADLPSVYAWEEITPKHERKPSRKDTKGKETPDEEPRMLECGGQRRAVIGAKALESAFKALLVSS
jgi:hypothetical protein